MYRADTIIDRFLATCGSGDPIFRYEAKKIDRRGVDENKSGQDSWTSMELEK